MVGSPIETPSRNKATVSTNQSEGMRYYFALNYFAGILTVPFNYLPALVPFNAPFYSTTSLTIILVGFGMTWIYDRWIRLKTSERPQTENSSQPFSNKWISVLSLAILFSGLKLISTLNAASFRSQIQTFADSSVAYQTFMGEHASILAVGIFVLSTPGKL